MQMQTRIQKIGNSKGMILPNMILNYFSLNERDIVELEITKEGVFMKPVSKEKPKRRNIEELFAQYQDDFIQEEEFDWGVASVDPIGDELW